MMKLLYKPFAIVGGIVAARIGRSVFESVWSAIDEAPPPSPGSGQGGIAKMVGGQALRAGVMAGSAAAVDRVFAGLFHHLVGAWPVMGPTAAAAAPAETE
jgi:hypothetical protein